LSTPKQEQSLALSGIFLALGEVRRIASHGQADRRRAQPCVRALLGDYEGSVLALYGERAELEPGIRQLIEHLERPNQAEYTGYLVAVLQLEKRLMRHPKYMGQLTDGLARARAQADYFGELQHANVISNLAELYTETVSGLRPRIVVRGERDHLENPQNAELIRVLLLSAVRAAAIWRASGGSRWRLIVYRKQLIGEARGFLTTV